MSSKSAPQWLSEPAKRARKLAYYAKVVSIIFAILMIFIGILNLLQILELVATWGVGAVSLLWFVVIFNLVPAIILAYMAKKIQENIIDKIDQGQLLEAKNSLLIFIIGGIIFGFVIGILLIFSRGQLKKALEIHMPAQYSNFQSYTQPSQQYGQAYPQPQSPQYTQPQPSSSIYQQPPKYQRQSHRNPQPARINPQHIQNIYSSSTPDKKKPTFDFGDFFSYRILQKIGSGGFSDVYLAERNGRKYAMKIPKGVDLSGSDTLELREQDLEGYGKEAEIWAMLTEREPNAVINLIDAGIHPFPWFAMELGERKLGDIIRTSYAKEKLEIASDLLGKLDRIHHYGVVHKDIKPDNILYAGGIWKFTDFGLSKVLSKSSKSSTGFSGTMFYMAPEQVSKKHFGNTDWRTDIWQMGVLIYEMLTGHLPFESDDAFEATGMILRDEPVPATRYGVDERVWNVVRKALEKKKEGRWQSASDFWRALENTGGY